MRQQDLFSLTICPLSGPNYLNLLNQLIAIWSSSGFFHLRPGAFHIVLQTHKTQYTQPKGWRKRKTNKHWLGLASRREKFVTLLCGFLCIWLSRACIRVNFQHSHQERWHILSRWLAWLLTPQVPTPRLTAAFLWTSPSPDFSWLPWNLAFPCLLPVS